MFGFGRKKTPPISVSAVIVAAGSAVRMEGIDKQQAPLAEIPVVVRAVSAFQACGSIHEIVLVCREEAIPDYYYLVQEHALAKVASVVGGGDNRQQSVFRGIAACSGHATHFAIHDGARPLITTDVIARCVADAVTHGAAAAGIPVTDTIKVIDGDGFVRATPERGELRAIQTPQVFRAGLYRAAMDRAIQEGRTYTDDCQLVERIGEKVFVSPGEKGNLKITTQEDLAIADAILRYREEGLEPWMD